MNKFKKPENDPLLTPIDYFNFYGSFISIFEKEKDTHIKSETEVCTLSKADIQLNTKEVTFLLKEYIVIVKRSNSWDLAIGSEISKFMLLSAIKFKGDNSKAQSYVMYELMKHEIPYIRVGTEYFKVFVKNNRYGIDQTILKAWDKTTITEDHGKILLSHINKFDDFTIIPNNKDFSPVGNGCYNLYCKFPHQSHNTDVSYNDIPVTLTLLTHIFGEQIQLGLKYMKVLYEYPKQILPVLSLVSTERETGKTTFLNWIQIIFGENSTLINPGDLTSNYNDSYATKNIIMIDETVIDKSNTIEKLKSIATAKTMSVSQKFVQHYSVPFFGKVIIATNKEKDFMRIDDDEIRFWIRKINSISGKKNTNIENDLKNEIPKFLRYLEQMPDVDFSKSRMVFTQDEIKTSHLDAIKEESKSTIRKEIEIYMENFFDNDTCDYIEVTAKDIKERWFQNNNQISISYIRKILKDEMKMEAQPIKKYIPFNNINQLPVTGLPFIFKRKSQVTENQIHNIFDEKEPF